MKIADEIREVLEDLLNLKTEYHMTGNCAICGFPLDKDVREKMVDQALKDILKLKVKLPPYKEITIHTHHNNIQRYSGYNDCLSDVTKLNEE